PAVDLPAIPSRLQAIRTCCYAATRTKPGKHAVTICSHRQADRSRSERLGWPRHVQPDGGAEFTGADLGQVTYLVDQPEPLSAGSIGSGPAVPGQRIGDEAAVLNLAQHLLVSRPEPDNPGAAGVPQRIGCDLAGGYHQVRAARRIQPRALPGGGNKLTHR